MAGPERGAYLTRAEARQAQMAYHYVRDRADLKVEPHGWKMPKVVKVKVTIVECR